VKTFIHGIYGTGKTFFAKQYAEKNKTLYIDFDSLWDYKNEKFTEQAIKVFESLPESFVIDAIPFDNKGESLDTFFNWWWHYDEAEVIIVYCSDREEWIKRINSRTDTPFQEQEYIDDFYSLIMCRIMCFKHRDIKYYDTNKNVYVSRYTFMEDVQWVFDSVSGERSKKTFDSEKLTALLKEQGYDWDYQDISVLGFESQFHTYKSWDHIKNLMNWGGKKIIDIGTNHGFMAFKLEKLGAKVLGLDIDHRKINTVKKIALVSQSSVGFQTWRSGEELPRCDIMLVLNVFHHILNKKEFFNEVDADKILFEIRKQDREMLEEYCDVISEHESHRDGRIILICEKKKIPYIAWYAGFIQDKIDETDTVLSLGCGVYQDLRGLKCGHLHGVDIFEPYIDKLRKEGYDVELDDITSKEFQDGSFDTVLLTDILEHLEYGEAIKLLEKAKKICRKSVIAYTPSVFFDNYHEIQVDEGMKYLDNFEWLEKNKKSPYRGLGKNEHQKHLCLVTGEDFQKAGFIVEQIGNKKSYFAVYNK
jgi:2-polyprenyl-3-methyl-5-hydroxy-6-metoxy-1,4-benzoquinol methylase